MLEKYLRFFRGAKGKNGEALPVAPGAEHALPPAIPTPVPGNVVDTRRAAPAGAVTSILTVETAGERTNTEKLRQRFLGRQPIVDRDQHIVGYELMLRSQALPTARKLDESLQRMYDETLVKCVCDLKISRLLDGKLAFLSVSPAMLDGGVLQTLPRREVVLAVRADPADPQQTLARCRALKAAGYQVAVDDFVYDQALEPLLEASRYVRVDISRFDALALARMVDRILQKASPQLFAKNVNTDEDFEVARQLYFHGFQGYYFTRLQPAAPHRIDSERVHVMELLNLVRSRAEIAALEEAFKHDAVLSYKLLRYINAPINGLFQEIYSIAHALIILGYDQLYRWLTLLLFTSGKVNPRSRPLLKNALVRARMMELLGERGLPPADREGLFITGIFSLLDVLLNVPMEQALERLSLAEPVVQALTGRGGIYAPYLGLVTACEEADEERIAGYAVQCGLTPSDVNQAQVAALVWAEGIER